MSNYFVLIINFTSLSMIIYICDKKCAYKHKYEGRCDFMEKYKQPNLFYKNLDTNYKDLYNSIQFEADYYHRTIHKVIQNLDTSKYGLEWKKVENFIYKIYIPSVIIIFKPKFEIQIEYNSTNIESEDLFDLKFLSMDWEPFSGADFRFQKNNQKMA